VKWFRKNNSTFFISLIVLPLLVYGCGGGGGGVLTGGVEGTVYKYNTTEIVRYAGLFKRCASGALDELVSQAIQYTTAGTRMQVQFFRQVKALQKP